MIDIENLMFTRIYEAVTAEYPQAEVVKGYRETFSRFPAVTVREVNNESYVRTLDNELEDHDVRVYYEVNVYCNDITGREEKCKAVFRIVDGVFLRSRFYRMWRHVMPNIDRTISRYYGRYRGIVHEAREENGDTVYQIYRK